MSTQYYLENEHIYLRNVTLADVNDRYYQWMNDAQVNQFLETRFVPQSKVKIAEFISAKDGDAQEILLAICDQKQNLHIGNIKLGAINWHHRRAEISLLIGDKKFWGQGIASQAITLVSQFAFAQLNLNKLQAGAYHLNKASIKAFEHVGFEQEGYIKEFTFINNLAINLVYLGLTRSQYYGIEA